MRKEFQSINQNYVDGSLQKSDGNHIESHLLLVISICTHPAFCGSTNTINCMYDSRERRFLASIRLIQTRLAPTGASHVRRSWISYKIDVQDSRIGFYRWWNGSPPGVCIRKQASPSPWIAKWAATPEWCIITVALQAIDEDSTHRFN